MSSLKNQVIKWCNMFLFQCRPIWYNVPRIYEICNVHLFSSHDKLKYSCQPFSLSMIFMSHRPSYNLIHLAIVLSHSEATSTTNHKVFHNHRHFRLLFFQSQYHLHGHIIVGSKSILFPIIFMLRQSYFSSAQSFQTTTVKL